MGCSKLKPLSLRFQTHRVSCFFDKQQFSQSFQETNPVFYLAQSLLYLFCNTNTFTQGESL
ncbi:MAG: hypothetical protein A3I75_00440 [Deltaproteobacteria bacterium RIFCSPLOWO2_02_FULL_50_16]|nr:MAG: hypothetical protein A3B79_05635 [Deltaproteobacteria bacterium RIFCSPHIGHO2_02_FULL_50_15]OGQ58515.1 MAG: hypothetical protein A3I75_00440 [Deltaproteobacteria bacterium RIFCSPLOWO2_02_FULL_50_16]OGQ67961.1 MAG: hypothetical protein A3F89_03540 [Deltaproteobacteria bacterium RIFCSPLOWO2_12_FULL_50_11]